METNPAERIADAEARSSMALAHYREIVEAGRDGSRAAERALAAAQRWLDKANELRGQGSLS